MAMRLGNGETRGRRHVAHQSVVLDAGRGGVRADINLPERSEGWVMILNGAISSRTIRLLNKMGIATVRLGIYVGAAEGELPVAAGELVAEATRSLCRRLNVPIAFLGSGPGGLAALLAASDAGCPVKGIVALDCRPDALEGRLGDIGAHVLLVTGPDHPDLVAEDRRAAEALPHGEVLVESGDRAAARGIASWLEALFRAPAAA